MCNNSCSVRVLCKLYTKSSNEKSFCEVFLAVFRLNDITYIGDDEFSDVRESFSA